MALEIPPWIRPPETGRQFATGLQLGTQIGLEQQKLQAAREEAAIRAQTQLAEASMAAQARAQQLQADSAEAAQRIEMERAYKDQVIGLRQQELADAAYRIELDQQYKNQLLDFRAAELSSTEQKNAALTRQASAKFAAQQQYRERVAAGEDPAKVMLELGPSMGASAGDFGASLRQTAMKAPGPLTAYPVMYDGKAVPGVISVPTASGGMATRNIPSYRPEGASPAEKAAAVSYLKEQRRELIAAIGPEPRTEEFRKKWEVRTKALRDQLKEIDQKIKGLLPALGGSEDRVSNTTTNRIRLQRNPESGKLEPVSQ